MKTKSIKVIPFNTKICPLLPKIRLDWYKEQIDNLISGECSVIIKLNQIRSDQTPPDKIGSFKSLSWRLVSPSEKFQSLDPFVLSLVSIFTRYIHQAHSALLWSRILRPTFCKPYLYC